MELCFCTTLNKHVFITKVAFKLHGRENLMLFSTLALSKNSTLSIRRKRESKSQKMARQYILPI